jgi:hypothetical protein
VSGYTPLGSDDDEQVTAPIPRQRPRPWQPEYGAYPPGPRRPVDDYTTRNLPTYAIDDVPIGKHRAKPRMKDRVDWVMVGARLWWAIVTTTGVSMFTVFGIVLYERGDISSKSWVAVVAFMASAFALMNVGLTNLIWAAHLPRATDKGDDAR